MRRISFTGDSALRKQFVAAAICTLLILSPAAPAAAQPPAGPAGDGAPLPELVAPDPAGVDLLSGGRVGIDSAISIGAADAPALELTEGGGGLGGTPLSGFHYTDGAYPRFSDFLVLGNRGAGNANDSGYALNLPDGMVWANGRLTEGDGTRWNFTPTGAPVGSGGTSAPSADWYLTTLVRPDGETLTYTYSNIPLGSIRGKLRSIRSSAGYQLNVEWEATTVGHRLKKITLTNRRYAYCDPQTGACTGAQAWPTMSWAKDAANNYVATTSGLRSVLYGPPQTIQASSGGIDPVTTWAGRITSGAAVNRTYTIRGGDGAWGQNLLYGRTLGVPWCTSGAAVIKVQEPGGEWNYAWPAYCPTGGWASGTRTDPLGRGSSRNGGTFTDELGRASTYTFINQFGSIAAPGKPFSRITSFTYPEGNKVTWDWGGAGGAQNLLSTTLTPKPGAGGPTLIWTKGYPTACTVATNINCNRPTHEIDARGKRTDYTYDPVHGALLTKSLPADDNGVRPQVRYTYVQVSAKVLDASGALVSEPPIWKLQSTSSCRTQSSCAGTADEVVTSYTYDDNLLVKTETVRAGDNSASSTVTRSYDHVGNLVSTDGPMPGPADTTRFVYDALRRLVATLGPDPDGTGPLPVPASRTTYNGDNQPMVVESGSAADRSDAALAAMTVDRKIVTTYDAAGRKASESLAGASATHSISQYGYDAAGRLECTAVRMNPAAFGSPPASACALGPQGSEGPDRITRNVHDQAGQLLTVQKAYGTPLQQNYAGYEYTANGQRKAVVDANGNRAELRYDGLDRQSCWIFPSKTIAGALDGDCSSGDFESYGYDSGGNRISLRKRDGSVLTYHYDGLNRIKAKIVPERAGLSPTHTRDVYYDYDLRGLMTKARFDGLGGVGITNVYDIFGRTVSSSSDMGGVARAVGNSYDSGGNRIRITHPDGSFFTYEQDGLGRPTLIRENGADPIAGFTYDRAGRTLRSGWAAVTDHAYDPAGRLQSLTHNLAGTSRDHVLGFAYNPAGQIVTRSASNDAFAWTGANVSRAYTVNGLNQYMSAGPATFGYDPNGNLSSTVNPANSTAYVYDVENRLVSASGAHNAELVYDPLGRLFQVTSGAGVRRLVYDGNALIAEYNGDGAMAHRYVHGNDPGADDPLVWFDNFAYGWRRALLTDHQGSVIQVADMYGNPVGTNSYDPWGLPGGTPFGRFGYTGQTWVPELGLWYYKARFYSPTLGRFLQVDPIGYNDQMNLYAYSMNDPVSKIDPTGQETILITWYDRFLGFSYGSHSAVYIPGPGKNTREGFLYDPSGSYMQRDTHGQYGRDETGTFDSVDLRQYLNPGLRDGYFVRLTTLRTTPAEENHLKERAFDNGDHRGFNCASDCSLILRDVPGLGKLNSGLPGRLAEQAAGSSRVIKDVMLSPAGVVTPIRPKEPLPSVSSPCDDRNKSHVYC